LHHDKPAGPTHAVTFDLSRGEVHLDLPSGEDHAGSLVVPGDALAALAQAAGVTAAAEFGRALGQRLGARVSAKLDAQVREASLDAVASALAGELAMTGLGTLVVERWGRALVLVLEGGSLGQGTGADVLRAAALAGVLARATGREVHTTSLARDGQRLRVLVASAATVGRARAMLDEGVSWGDVIARLHGAARAASEEASA
jgi:hypothetical protein